MLHHIYDKEPDTMSDQNSFSLVLSNQDEMKVDIKDVKNELRTLNSRVTKVETDNAWKQKYVDWGTKLLLVGSGILLGMLLEWFIMRGTP